MADTSCCVCGKDIKTPACPHPWEKAFSDWPPELLAQARRIAPNPEPSK